MYDELVKSLRDKADFLDKTSYERNVHNAFADAMKQAADAIEELICEVADEHNRRVDAEERQRWVPVAERLPKKPKNYPNCKIRRTYFLVALESGCVESLGYEFDRDEWQITGSPVVAWMPLPEPPKEE